LHGAPTQHRHAAGFGIIGDCLHQPRLTDSGFADHEQHAAPSGDGRLHGLTQLAYLRVSSDESGSEHRSSPRRHHSPIVHQHIVV
jgi:hypothetical protein